jgi:tetratricopeptide (TPR) repeat protein
VKRFGATYAGVQLLGLACAPAIAQIPLHLPVDPEGITALNDKSMGGYDVLRKIFALQDYDKEIAQYPALVAENKEFIITDNGNANVVFSIEGLLKKNHPDEKVLAAQLAVIDKSYQTTAPVYAFGYFSTRMASALLKLDYLGEARRYAILSVALFDEEDCRLVERYEDASRAIYDQKKSKTPLHHVYYEEDGAAHCASDHADRVAILGKVEAKLGETEEAATNFNAALMIHANVDSYVGLAEIEEAAGDKAQALKSLTAAYLTGRLDPDHIARAKALFLELNPGSTDAAYSALMDREYAQTFVNPVKVSAAPASWHRVVLDEFFTGADCEPCTAPDLATEAALSRYTRDQFVVAIYHNNAPSSDPLTNHTGEDRSKYYDTKGSTPHTFLNGKELDLEEGLATHSQIAFDQLTANVDKLLAEPAGPPLELSATEDGAVIEVRVNGKQEIAPQNGHLQVLLLENPVSYSGYNTLRFHPMVVRASAEEKPGSRGFEVAAGSAVSRTVNFNLDKIEQDNLAYYDDSVQALAKRLSAMISSGALDKTAVEKMGEFREHKNLIDPRRLAVIAFLQDDATKQVYTASYVTVTVKNAAGAE